MSTVSRDVRLASSWPGTGWLVLGGVVGPVAFLVAITVAGFIRPGYSQVHQAISDLGVGSNPWLLNLPLIALGPLLTAFAVGFWQSLGRVLGGRWRWICTVLIALPGLGCAWAGVFTEAPPTTTLHWVVVASDVGDRGTDVLIMVGSVVGFLVTGLRLRRIAGWGGWGTYSIVSSALTLALFGSAFALWTAGIGGLLERLWFFELLGWYFAFGWRLYRGRRRTPC